MVVDIIFVILLFVIIFIGYKKGGVKIITKLASVVIGFILAYMLAENVGNFILNNTSFGQKMNAAIEQNVETVLEQPSSDEEKGVISSIIDNLTSSVKYSKDVLKGKIVRYIFVGVGFGITYIIVRIIITIIGLILEKVFDLPGLVSINKLVGIILSVVIFMLEISIIFALLYYLSSFSFANKAVDVISSGIITSAIYNNNIVVMVVSNIIS